MARTYHDAPITAAQFDKVLASMNSVSKASNNGKILCVDDFGFLTAKTQQELHIGAVLEPVTINENGTVTPPDGVDGFDSVTVDVQGSAPVLQNKIVTQNGVVTPDMGYDGLGEVTVDVPGGGYPEPTGTIQITQNGTVNVKDYASAEVNVPTSGYPEPTGTIQIAANGTANVKDYASANVNVPNSYTAADEGKVVKNGALVAQTAMATAITANGTYNTAENNSVTVNVSGGGSNTFAFIVATYPAGATCTATNGSITLTAPDTSGTAVFAVPTPSSTPETWTITATVSGASGSNTASVSSYGARYEVSIVLLPNEYKAVEYIEVGSTAGPYINTAYSLNSLCEFEVKSQYTGTPNNNSWLFGAYSSGKQTNVGYTKNRVYLQTGGKNVAFALDTLPHVYASKQNAFYYDGTAQTGVTPNWANTATVPTRMFYIGDGAYSNNCRMYYCKIWDNRELVRHFIPCYRKADNKPGMYDIINNVFYTNDGNSEFVLGPEV